MDGVVWAVALEAFHVIVPGELKRICAKGMGPGVVCDVKGQLDPKTIEEAGILYGGLHNRPAIPGVFT